MQISILHSNKCCREENFTTVTGVGCTKPDLFCPMTPPRRSPTCSAPLPHTPLPLLLVLKWFPQSLCWDGCCKGCSIFQLHQVRKHSFLHARNPVKNSKNINCKGDHLSIYKCMFYTQSPGISQETLSGHNPKIHWKQPILLSFTTLNGGKITLTCRKKTLSRAQRPQEGSET